MFPVARLQLTLLLGWDGLQKMVFRSAGFVA